MDIKKMIEAVTLEDGHILLGKPLELTKYGKKFTIEPVNWFYDWQDFSYCLGVFLHYYYIVCENTKLPENLNEMHEFKDNIRTTMSHKRAFSMLCKVCKYSGLKLRWMKKHFNINDWVEVFLYVYLFNIKGVKKNFKDALKLLGHQL